MAKLICSYETIGYTLLQMQLDTELMENLITPPHKNVVGYATCNSDIDDYKFITKEEVSTDHWSLDILKKYPNCQMSDTWIVFNCPPDKTRMMFTDILFGEAIHIDKWDIWSVEGKDDNFAVVTSWEIY